MHVCIYVCMYVCCMFVRKYVQIKYIYVCKHIYGGDNRQQKRHIILQGELFYWYTFHFHGIPWSGVVISHGLGVQCFQSQVFHGVANASSIAIQIAFQSLASRSGESIHTAAFTFLLVKYKFFKVHLK